MRTRTRQQALYALADYITRPNKERKRGDVAAAMIEIQELLEQVAAGEVDQVRGALGMQPDGVPDRICKIEKDVRNLGERLFTLEQTMFVGDARDLRFRRLRIEQAEATIATIERDVQELQRRQAMFKAPAPPSDAIAGAIVLVREALHEIERHQASASYVTPDELIDRLRAFVNAAGAS